MLTKNDAIVYDFKKNLNMSKTSEVNNNVKDIIMKNFPGALSVLQSHRENDLLGVDWWVEQRGYFISIDCKIGRIDYSKKENGNDYLSLETWSVVERKKIGWTRDPNKHSDYILWLWKDSGRWCIVPFPMLCHVFVENWVDWRKLFKTARQYTPTNTGGYHSECVFVPRKTVWKTIFETFA